MTKMFTYLSNWRLKYTCALFVLLCAGVGNVWASTKTTTFKDKTSGTWAQNTNPLPYESGGIAWAASATPNSFESASPSRYVQWSASSIKNTSFTITNTSLASYSIAKVSLVASTNSNGNLVHISVSVGGTSFGSANMSKANNTTYNFPSTGQNAATGNIVITISGDNNSNTKSFYIKSITVTYCAVPTSPTNGTITASTADLSWTDAASVGHYDVYCSTSSTAPAINVTPTVSGTTNKYATVTSLSSSTQYYWWVRAYDNDCKSKWVAGSSFTTSAAVSTYTIYVPNTADGCSSLGSFTSDEGDEGSGTGTWDGYTTYSGITAGTTVTITATPESGYKFDGWTSSGSSIILDDEDEEITPSSTTSNTATFDMPSSDVYIMECAFSTACDKTMTISKGTETNCTFSLGTSGSGIASCDGVSTTVTVSPSTGYGNASVTQSGASATPTITGSGTRWTVAYGANTTGTSTIAVSCSANNYTITLDNESATTSGTANITATYNDDNNLDGTPAITVPAKTGWTFEGYYTSKQGGGTQIIAANGNVNASAGGGSTYTDGSKNWKYTNNITLYAKWTCTVTWSVNKATNVYSTQTVTYNSSGCKVASVPDGSDLDLEDYCGDKFMGWTSDENYVHGTSNLFTNVAGSPNITGNVTFYAVFADYAE